MNADRSEPRASAHTAVTAFIDTLRRRLKAVPADTPLPEAPESHVRQVRLDEDLVARFAQAATAVGLEVHAASPANWMDVVGDILIRVGREASEAHLARIFRAARASG